MRSTVPYTLKTDLILMSLVFKQYLGVQRFWPKISIILLHTNIPSVNHLQLTVHTSLLRKIIYNLPDYKRLINALLEP